MAVDFTAAHDIDHKMGNVHVLVLGADNMDLLVARLNQLYGGNWEAIPREETEMNYYLEYGTQEQRMKALEDLRVYYERKRSETTQS